MKIVRRTLQAVIVVFALPLMAQEQAEPAYGTAETLKLFLTQWIGQGGVAQPVGTIPLLFDFNIGPDKLRFLSLRDDGVYFMTDNIPTAERYVALPIKPNLEKIITAGDLKELLDAVAGGQVKNIQSILDTGARQFLKSAASSGNVTIRVAYPSELHLSALKITFDILPSNGVLDERKIKQLNLQFSAIPWLQGIKEQKGTPQ